MFACFGADRDQNYAAFHRPVAHGKRPLERLHWPLRVSVSCQELEMSAKDKCLENRVLETLSRQVCETALVP